MSFLLSLSFLSYFDKTLSSVFSQIIELYKSLKYATVELDAGKREGIQQKEEISTHFMWFFQA